MEKFLAAVKNMFNVPDLRRRIFFTLGLLAVYRLGAHVGAPGINKARLDQVWSEVAGTLLGVLDLFSGGNFRTISIFALGVTPLHHRLNYSAADDRCVTAVEKVAGRGGDGPAENQPVDSISHGWFGRNPNFVCGPLASGQWRRCSNLGILANYGPDAYHGNNVRDVAG
jgi:hypothetical protein